MSDARVDGSTRPLEDESIDDLHEPARRWLATLWLSQAATELRVAMSFKVIAESARLVSAAPGVIQMADRAVRDEHAHAELCQSMAARYAGGAVVAPPRLPFEAPTHPHAPSEHVRRALFIIGQCTFNETFASAYLQLALSGARVPEVRAALRQLLADEVDHARIGWAYVQSLDGDIRGEVERSLWPLAMANLREWRTLSIFDAQESHGTQAAGLSPAALRAHGFPRGEAVEAALREVLADLIIPSLGQFGFRVDHLTRWVREGAPTPA
jgi:hypothetical protein